MSVHLKLSKARTKIHSMNLKKSGKNTFSHYEYYELGDFLPAATKIFDELGLCGVISYGKEMAVLTIADTESGQIIEITSPMSEANLKGMHPVQNLGAVQTYIRRYLWITALELTDGDAIDATAGDEPPAKPKPKKVEPKVEEKPLEVPEGMSILEFAEKIFTECDNLTQLQQMFKQCYIATKANKDEQTVVTNLYNARKAELGAA